MNDARKAGMAARVVATCGGSVRGRTIAVLGLTFKPETDDMPGSPNLPVVHCLVKEGAKIRALDPESMEAAKPMLPDTVMFCQGVPEALEVRKRWY